MYNVHIELTALKDICLWSFQIYESSTIHPSSLNFLMVAESPRNVLPIWGVQVQFSILVLVKYISSNPYIFQEKITLFTKLQPRNIKARNLRLEDFLEGIFIYMNQYNNQYKQWDILY